jgi:hypothetical protein
MTQAAAPLTKIPTRNPQLPLAIIGACPFALGE